MSNLNSTTGTQVFYAFLKFKTGILCEEKDKKQFLDFALSARKKYGERILAFAVLDGEVHFLILRSPDVKEQQAGESVIREIEQYLKKELLSDTKVILQEKGWQQLHTKEEIKRVCRTIHRLPLEQGYVGKLRDYWWSSYQTYRGGYQWEGLDPSFLWNCFSEKQEDSIRLFLQYHRRES